MRICANEACTGCGACMAVCRFSSIIMSTDEKGFLRPVIDEQKCKSCLQCIKFCPQNKEPSKKEPLNVYAAFAKNNDIREKSSSGGIFSLLAQKVVKKGGVIFGAAFCDGLKLKHIEVTSEKELELLRGSKYVQSEIGNTYTLAKKHLDEGRTVLFSGTPCQIDGLKSILGKEYGNLFTVDILCHGVPSPMIFNRYIAEKQKQYGEKIVNVLFRHKEPGWKTYKTKLVLESGKGQVSIKDEYMDAFLSNLILRESCYSCRYTTKDRMGDITLGDYWGYKETAPEYIEDDDRGMSFVSVNTEKGKQLFKGISKDIVKANRSIEDASRGNAVLKRPSKVNAKKDLFWNVQANTSWDELKREFFNDMPQAKDYVSKEDREYYKIPYTKRHTLHVLRCVKNSVIDKLRGK